MHSFMNDDRAGTNGVKVRCPLSGSENVTLLEKVKTKDLVWSYNRILKLDTTEEFQNMSEIGFYHCPDSDLNFFSPAATGSESFYEKLQGQEWYYLEDKEEFDYARQYITSVCHVLEVGSGRGAFARNIPAERYVGLEFSRKAIEDASPYNKQILKESIELHANGNPERYDIICAFQVLEHVADLRSFIENCLACLRPGGLLIYSVPSADSFIGIARNNPLNMPPHHLSWWTDKSLEFVAGLFKLEIVDIHHEKLSEIHKRWYATTLLLESFRNLFGLDIPILDISFKTRFLSWISSKCSFLLEKGLSDRRNLPVGHSATAVYKKPIRSEGKA